MSLTVQIDIHEALKRANATLKHIPGEAQKVMGRVLNRVNVGVQTDITRSTTQKYHVIASDIRETISVRRASSNNLLTSIISRGTRRSLADYRLRPETGPLKRGQALRGAVMKDGGMKSLGNAFLMRRKNAQGESVWRPYIRTGTDKRDIKPLISPAIPQTLANPETVERAQQGASERFEKRFRHEIMRAIGVIK